MSFNAPKMYLKTDSTDNSSNVTLFDISVLICSCTNSTIYLLSHLSFNYIKAEISI